MCAFVRAGGYDPVYGEGYIAFIVWALLLVVAYARIAHVAVDKELPKLRRQLTVVRWGTILAIALAILVNLVLPSVLQTSFYAQFTPVIGVVYVVTLAFAIVRFGLLDIKMVIIRSVTYVLSIAILALVYYAASYFVTALIFRRDVGGAFSFDPLNTLLALILAFIFQPIRAFFDRFTNSIFYRHDYNRDMFLREFSRIVSLDVNLSSLSRKASQHIAQTLSIENIFFYIIDQGVMGRHGATRKAISAQDVSTVGKWFDMQKDADNAALLLYDYVEKDLQLTLRKYEARIVMPLRVGDRVSGYLFIGARKSKGYSPRDIQTLSMINGELSIAIQNALSVEEVRDLNRTLERRIVEATKELRASNRQLKRLDEAKTEFISMASHQLRTPLTSVKGYLDMVLQGDLGEITGMQRKALSEAFLSTERMVSLINDFLNVSRLQTGKFVIDRSEGDLKEIVRGQVAMLRVIAKQHGQVIEDEIDEDVPRMLIDVNKVRQVVLNFLDNAVYYSKPNTTIRVSLKKEGNDVVLVVKDHGIGVPAEDQERLFGRFFRAENARRHRPDGTGVGLFLAKKVVTLHGGSVIFASKEGEGSTFGFRLPIVHDGDSGAKTD